jgi:hypothetical protein
MQEPLHEPRHFPIQMQDCLFRPATIEIANVPKLNSI